MRSHPCGETVALKLDMGSREGDVISAGDFETFVTCLSRDDGGLKTHDDDPRKI
jgi:hypothetical protein